MKLVSASGDIYPLQAGETVLGRGDSCHIVLDDPRISRQHATVYVQGSTYLIKDNRSTNGTQLNGQRVNGVQRIKDGDAIALAGVVFTFSESEVEDPTLIVKPRKLPTEDSARDTSVLPLAYLESQNKGVRLPSQRAADAYRREREGDGGQFPFVVYRFGSVEVAESALLAMPDFHRATDKKSIITLRRYVYGVFGLENGRASLFLGGEALNAETWQQFAQIASRRGAVLINGRVPQSADDKGPKKNALTMINPAKLTRLISTELVRFNRAITVPESNPPRAVLIFEGENDETARTFLKDAPLVSGVESIVVETPERTWTRDESGFYIS